MGDEALVRLVQDGVRFELVEALVAVYTDRRSRNAIYLTDESRLVAVGSASVFVWRRDNGSEVLRDHLAFENLLAIAPVLSDLLNSAADAPFGQVGGVLIEVEVDLGIGLRGQL